MRRPSLGDPATRARLVVAALAVAIAAVVVGSTAGSTAAFSPYNDGWDGTADLLREARAGGATADVLVATDGYAVLDPDATVVVVLSPARPYDAADAERVRAFVAAGGTLVVAEDAGPHGNALLAATGATARFDGRTLRDERFHARSPALPVARDVTPHPLTRDVDLVTLNYGTAVVPGEATVLVRTSPFAYLDGNGDALVNDDEPLAAFPVVAVETVGEGRVVAVGDPSAFVDAMLVRPGNRALARALLAGPGVEYVAVDASHGAGTPPLALARHALATTPALQAAVLVAGAFAVGAWTVAPTVAARARRRRDGSRPATPRTPQNGR